MQKRARRFRRATATAWQGSARPANLAEVGASWKAQCVLMRAGSCAQSCARRLLHPGRLVR